MWWKLVDGKLTAEKDISRDPFGDFEITFKMSAQNGAMEMEIRNRIGVQRAMRALKGQ